MTSPLILLTNDDGIHATGLRHLWEALQGLGTLAVVAPASDASGSGVSITWARPLHVRSARPEEWNSSPLVWSLNGTPADCVKMALSTLLPNLPALIVSGVNHGSNSGRTTLYSGTVGGVIEGILKGIPGIAFSYSDVTPPPLEATRSYLRHLVHDTLQTPLPKGTLLNVNFPYGAGKHIRGLCWAKQGDSGWTEAPDRRLHPEGFPYYWLGGKWNACQEDPESDVALLEQGYITMVPLQIADLTNYDVYRTHLKNRDVDIPKQLEKLGI